MRLIDAIQVKQGWFEIPDCSRNDLPEFFKAMGYKTGVEVGVWKGEFTEQFCLQGFRMYAVDPWAPYVDFKKKKGWPDDSLVDQEKFYRMARQRLDKYPNCTIIRKTSMDAVNDFKDNSIDFVYLDGHHGFRYIAEDLCEWTKKVRPGGIIAGHDYLNSTEWSCHVAYVVDAYVRAFEIDNLYILGSAAPVVGEARDRERSWMWFRGEA